MVSIFSSLEFKEFSYGVRGLLNSPFPLYVTLQVILMAVINHAEFKDFLVMHLSS